MVTAVAVQDIDGVDLIEIVLQSISSEYAGYARIKTGTQDSGNSGLLVLILISPLP